VIKILSIQVGQPRQIIFGKKEVQTSIFKNTIASSVFVDKLGLVGDTQSDLSVHGGLYKAVYAYPQEHMDYWKKQMSSHLIEPGAFGENLTTEGLLESEGCIGDSFQIGDVVLRITQPRFPCYKLNAKFGDAQMVKRFQDSGRPGIYFEVLKTGSITVGDELVKIDAGSDVSINQFVSARMAKEPDTEVIARILAIPSLIKEWKDYFEKEIS
jgi:MOSC domain-containing protein YiiM